MCVVDSTTMSTTCFITIYIYLTPLTANQTFVLNKIELLQTFYTDERRTITNGFMKFLLTCTSGDGHCRCWGATRRVRRMCSWLGMSHSWITSSRSGIIRRTQGMQWIVEHVRISSGFTLLQTTTG